MRKRMPAVTAHTPRPTAMVKKSMIRFCADLTARVVESASQSRSVTRRHPKWRNVSGRCDGGADRQANRADVGRRKQLRREKQATGLSTSNLHKNDTVAAAAAAAAEAAAAAAAAATGTGRLPRSKGSRVCVCVYGCVCVCATSVRRLAPHSG